jgi:alpha-1,2-mannosyltransferase
VASWSSGPGARRRVAALASDPVSMVIVASTLAGLALRLFYLAHGGFLLGVTEYDDGSYFGSAVRLTQGVLPYRDFVLVQPPGITLLMVPSALLAKVAGSAWGLASGRILTMLAGAASVPLMGLLVRRRGLFVTLVACGVTAVYPDAVAAAHTVLVEPWLVLFCLVGALLVFDDDQLAGRRRRLVQGGVAFGFAGAVEAWAIVPVAVLLVLCVLASPPGRLRLNRAASFAAGVAAGFLVPSAPFAATSPRGFYRSLIVAQIAPRQGGTRVGLLERLYDLTGLSDVSVAPASLRVPVSFLFLHGSWPLTAVVWDTAGVLVLIIVGGPAFLILTRDQPPTRLGWFALASTALVVAMLLWPGQFHYHFAAFLAPFLALAIALPLAALAAPATARAGPGGPARSPRRGWLTAAAAVLLVAFTMFQANTEGRLKPGVPAQSIARADRLIPPGSCVVSDQVTLLLLANRFSSGAPGCIIIDDGRGTDLALSHGLTPETGAGDVPAVAAQWRASFYHAQFLWLSYHYANRVAGSPALWIYVRQHFRLIYADHSGDTLYRRTISFQAAPAAKAKIFRKG